MLTHSPRNAHAQSSHATRASTMPCWPDFASSRASSSSRGARRPSSPSIPLPPPASLPPRRGPPSGTVRRVQLRPACGVISCSDREAAQTSTTALGHDHTTPKAQQWHEHRGGDAAIRYPPRALLHERKDHCAAARGILCSHTEPRPTLLRDLAVRAARAKFGKTVSLSVKVASSGGV